MKGPNEISDQFRDVYDLDARARELLFNFVALVEGARLNVTAWKGEVLWERGVMESLALQSFLPKDFRGRGLDIGSGGGFPGIVLAIAYLEGSWTLIDSRVRRSQFLNEVVERLGLPNVNIVNERAEQWIKDNPIYRSYFDFVTLRAVAPKMESLELGLPYVRIGGSMLLAQGMDKDMHEENTALLVRRLGGRIGEAVKHGEGRQTIRFEKTEETPLAYPRSGKALGRI